MSYFAAALARTPDGWTARELDLDGAADVDEVADRVRDLDAGAETALLFVEEDDEYLVDPAHRRRGRRPARLRLRRGTPRTRTRWPRSSSLAVEGSRARRRPTTTSRRAGTTSRLGDADLLADLGTNRRELVALVKHEGTLPADVITEVCQRAGCVDELEDAARSVSTAGPYDALMRRALTVAAGADATGDVPVGALVVVTVRSGPRRRPPTSGRGPATRPPTPRCWRCGRRPGRSARGGSTAARSWSRWSRAPCAPARWCWPACHRLVFGALRSQGRRGRVALGRGPRPPPQPPPRGHRRRPGRRVRRSAPYLLRRPPPPARPLKSRTLLRGGVA